MIRALLIAPYQRLATAFEAVAAGHDQVKVDSFVGNLDDALVYFNHYFHNSHYDVIISRGGTAKLIREHTTIPVVEIDVSILDALYSIKLAEQTGRPFVTVGFPNISSAVKILSDILGSNLAIHEIDSKDSAEAAISALASAEKPCVILGDTVTVDIASRLGLDGILIDSGRESLEKALENAVNIAQHMQRTAPVNAMHSDILEQSPQCIVAFNQLDNLCYMNHSIADISSTSIAEMLKSYIPEVRKNKTLHFKKRIKPYRLDIFAVEQYSAGNEYVFFFIDVSSYYSPRSLQGLMTEESMEDVKRKELLSIYPPSYLNALMNQADKVFAVDRPLVVYGEAGTGKDALVNSIYLKRCGGSMPLVTIYCPLLDKASWEDLIRDPGSPLYGSSNVIYFKSIHAMPLNVQHMLDRFLTETNLLRRNCVICSSRMKLADMVVNSLFVQSLYVKLELSSIFISPLRDQPEEIRSFASHFLNCYNSQYVKHLLGFREDAIELLYKHPWYMNIEELRQTIKKLVMACDANYISADAVNQVLLSLPNYTLDAAPIDLTKTLDEIELDIIKHVLINENMSHSQAAARLGISRSTLWRKLNQGK